MNAAEIIELIRLLPREEQEQVASFLHALRQQNLTAQPADGVSEEFKRVAANAFETNDKLFKKLATMAHG